MKKISVCGCSFSVGIGLELEKQDPRNYANLVANNLNAQINNLAAGGNSNYRIFMSALEEILTGDSELVLVQWTVLSRLWLYPGPDTEMFLPLKVSDSYSYRGIKFSQSELQHFSNMYHLLNHDFRELLTLIKYCKLLAAAAEQNQKRLVFINGLLPWTSDIADHDMIKNFSNMSDYTKELLSFDSRDDEELTRFFLEMCDAVNSLDKSQWVNIFDSFIDNRLDYGTDKLHPGPLSHARYAEMIIQYIKTTND